MWFEECVQWFLLDSYGMSFDGVYMCLHFGALPGIEVEEGWFIKLLSGRNDCQLRISVRRSRFRQIQP